MGVREAPNSVIKILSRAYLKQGYGVEGDRAWRFNGGKRQVTIFQAEYLPVLASLHPSREIHFQDLRRNIAIAGINLNTLVGEHLSVGKAILEITGLCHPCAKMERQLGAGAYNALRGHGGLTAKVAQSGIVRLDDVVAVESSQQALL